MRSQGVALTGLLVGAVFFAPSRPLRPSCRLETRTLAAVLDDRGFLLEPSGWGLSPGAWGRPGNLKIMTRLSPSMDSARVLYPRPGILEWHAARPEGIEQGFEVLERPDGRGPLVVEQEVRGGLRLVEAMPDGLSFGAVEYRGLKAFDARGRALPARMALDGRRLSLVVEDEGACYPVSIDPLSSSPSWVVETNQAGGHIGVQNFGPAGDVNGDGYTDLIAGGDTYDNGEVNEGRAWVFHGGSAGLSTTPAWVVENNQASAAFGRRVSTAGDVDGDGFSDVLVSSPSFDNGLVDEGRAYVFHGSASGLTTAANWTAESDATSGAFCLCASGAGDVNGDGYSDVAVSTPYMPNGKVVVYHGSSTGLPAASSWSYSNPGGFGWFGGNSYGGRPMAGVGDVNGDGYSDLAVGAYSYSNGQSGEGRVWVFHGSSTGLGASPAVVFEPNEANTQFGIALCGGDVNGDGYSDLIVGCPIWSNGEANEGRALAYHGASGGLNTAAVWVTEPNQAGADYGWYMGSADVNGDGFSDILAGADVYTNGETSEGRVFLYHGGSSGASTTAVWTQEVNQISCYLGSALEMGDVNGDGYSDALLGASGYTNGQAEESRCYVYHFSPGTVTFNTYDLPGTKRMMPVSDEGNMRIERGQSRVVRDSNGYWYFVWEPHATDAQDSSNKILLSYTTTDTPTGASAWSTITLVDDGATGVINQDAATQKPGWAPALAMSTSDELHFVYAGPGDATLQYTYLWTKCTNLAGITDPASWATIKRVAADTASAGADDDIDIALDSNNILHAVYVDNVTPGSPRVKYTRFDTATDAFFTTHKTLETVDRKVPRIDVDLDNNLYALFHSTGDTCNAYLLCSTNAYVTSPADSAWRNLALTNSIADTATNSSEPMDRFSAAQLCVDRNGVVHVIYRNRAQNSRNVVTRRGRIGAGITQTGGFGGPNKRLVGISAVGKGEVWYSTVDGGGGNRDMVTLMRMQANTVYRSPPNTSNFVFTSDLAWSRAQGLWAERRPPRNRNDSMWFIADAQRGKISTSWSNRVVSVAGWSPPIQQKRQPHPHLTWVFPNTAVDLETQPLPVVALTSKSAVYTVDAISGGHVFAVDRASGILSRSYVCTGTAPTGTLVAAAYAGNVHLFQFVSASDLLKLTDNGSDLVRDTGWANNPQPVSFGGSSAAGQFLFYSQGGTRYLYAIGDVNTTIDQYGLYKYKADNGVLVGGFPVVGTTGYVQQTGESLLRVLNDQVFIPEDYSYGGRIYRRDADGSGEISGPATMNNVLRLIQVRDADRLFICPEERVLWQLSSGLQTVGWTSGKSANLGVNKTSGAYYTRDSGTIFVGAGNQLYRLNASAGTLMSNWPMDTTGNVTTLPVKWKTFVYFGTSSGRLYAVNATTNVSRANWPVVLDTTVSTPSVRSVSFDAVYGHAYFATSEGRVYKLSLE